MKIHEWFLGATAIGVRHAQQESNNFTRTINGYGAHGSLINSDTSP